MSTYYMALDLPTVTATPGPLWAAELNAALDVVDQHDHTSGKGRAVPTSGLNINADLTFAQLYSAIDLKATNYFSQVAPLSSTFVSSIYDVNGDLYWNNGSGQSVKITDGTTLNAASIGGIGGDYGGVGVMASEQYELASDTYHFYEDPSLGVPTYSDIKASGVKFVNDSYVGTQYQAKVINSANQTENYNLTLPPAISSGSGYKLLEVDTSGNMRATSSSVTTRQRAFTSFLINGSTATNFTGNATKTEIITFTVIPSGIHNLINGQKYTLTFAGILKYYGTAVTAISANATALLEIKQGGSLISSITFNTSTSSIPNSVGDAACVNPALDFTMSDATQTLDIIITLTYQVLGTTYPMNIISRKENLFPVII